jgi:flagellar motility protein MotE (MotC chaperone)
VTARPVMRRLRRPFPFVIVLLAACLAAKAGLLGERLTALVTAPRLVSLAEASSGVPAADADPAPAKPLAKAAAGNCQPQPSPVPPPPIFSDAEIAVLQQLGERRDALAARESELDRDAALLRATEVRIDEKVASLKVLQATLEGLIRQHDAEQEAKLTSLVKIYESMKPKDAARIFEELDLETLLPVAERMNERRLAPVMAVMNPAKAKDITVELKRLRQLNEDGKS